MIISNILIFFVLSILIPNALISVSISSVIIYWRTKEVKFLTLPIAYYIMQNMLNYVHKTTESFKGGDDEPNTIRQL